MVRPKNFGFNEETAYSNSFQNKVNISQVAEKALREFDNMVEVLKKNHIQVKVFDDIKEGLKDSVFPNNWISQFPNGELVIYPMATLIRAKEVRSDIIDWVKKLKAQGDFIDLRKRSDNYLEGTGSIVFDYQNKMAYASLSVRTDKVLFENLMNELGYKGLFFESFDLNNELIYHTNVMMSIAENYTLICSESIHDDSKRRDIKENLINASKELIELDYDQMNNFLANSFEVRNDQGESILLMSDSAFKSLKKEQIDKVNNFSRIVSIPIPTIEKIGGGSVRCMIAGLFS